MAQVVVGRGLPLAGAITPAHAAAVNALREAAVVPLLGEREHLTEADWSTLKQKLVGYEQWILDRQVALVEKLGESRIIEILESNAHERLTELIAKDTALKAEAESLENVEKLVLFHRDLHLICTNFVNFQDFYDGDAPAVFQCGTLYLD